MVKQDIKSLTELEVREYMKTLNEPSFRGTQIFSWIYKNANDFSEMRNIPKKLVEKLNESAYIENIEIYKKLESKIDGTRKYLFKLSDGNIIESVMMKYKHGVSVCISTQVGCKMGCSFCASGIGGLKRNLSPGELLEQVLKIQNDVGERVSNIVLMGTGEPLDNYDNVIQFFKIINDENGLNIGLRHITLSTCGVVPKIYDLAKLKLQINLAISLHTPYQDKRMEIMPISRKYDINELMESCRYYLAETGRRITFEYSLIKNVNDSKRDAHALSKLLKGMLCHVNLIPVNSVEENSFTKPDKKTIEEFMEILKRDGIETTVRREMGSDINGACGQLRQQNL